MNVVVMLRLCVCVCVCVCFSLPNEMGNMPQLKSLLLDGNPLKTLRRDVMQVCGGEGYELNDALE